MLTHKALRHCLQAISPALRFSVCSKCIQHAGPVNFVTVGLFPFAILVMHVCSFLVLTFLSLALAQVLSPSGTHTWSCRTIIITLQAFPSGLTSTQLFSWSCWLELFISREAVVKGVLVKNSTLWGWVVNGMMHWSIVERLYGAGSLVVLGRLEMVR